MNRSGILLSRIVLALSLSSPLLVDAGQRGSGPMMGMMGGSTNQSQSGWIYGQGMGPGTIEAAGFMQYGTGRTGTRAQVQGMPHSFGPEFRATRIFNRLDVDADNLLTQAEFVDRPDEIGVNQFMWLDSDGDGLISREEYLDAHAESAVDMAIDRDALHACMSEQMGDLFNDPSDREEHFDVMDIDGNGTIDTEEFSMARNDSVTQRFMLIDVDADSVITPDELVNALGTLQQRHDMRRDCMAEQQDINYLLGE